MSKFAILHLFFLGIYMVACVPSNRPQEQIPTKQTAAISEANTNEDPLSTHEPISSTSKALSTPLPPDLDSYIYAVEDIPAGYVHHIFWSQDSKFVFFQIDNEEWLYDLSIHQSRTASNEDIEAFTQLPTPESPFPILVALPKDAELATASSSNQKAVFIRKIPTPTSTPPLTPLPTDGEVPELPILTELFIWQSGTDKLKRVTTIKMCGQNRFMWSKDEKFVAIQTTCLFPEAWVIDFEQEKIHAILPLNQYGGFVDLYSFSPNQDKLLISYMGSDEGERLISLYILDLNTFETTRLDTPRFAQPAAWITQNELLILYSHEFGVAGNDRPAIFNLQTEELRDLLDVEHKARFDGLDVQWVSLSPGKEKIAFTVAHEPFKKSSLWLLDLNQILHDNN